MVSPCFVPQHYTIIPDSTQKRDDPTWVIL